MALGDTQHGMQINSNVIAIQDIVGSIVTCDSIYPTSVIRGIFRILENAETANDVQS